MTEEWRAVPGWSGFYEVSDAGNVRSLDRRWPVTNRFGNVENRQHRGKLLKLGVLKNGYQMVSLTRPGGVRRYAYVHNLVAEAFIGPKPLGEEVCHRDGVRTHNALRNLRYGTRSSNALDRHVHGTMNQARGVDHYHAKLDEDAVRRIRELAPGMSRRALGRMFGVRHRTVSDVVERRSWKHV